MATARQRRDGLLRGVPKDFRRWVKLALSEGWTLDQRGTHTVLTAPTGYKVPVPSCANNGLRTAFRRQLETHGVNVTAHK